MGQGKEKTKAYLDEHPEVAAAMEAGVRAAMLSEVAEPATSLSAEVEGIDEEVLLPEEPEAFEEEAEASK